MKIQKSHKIQLDPNDKQANHLTKACGVSRFTYNWGLTEWNKDYKNGGNPTALKLAKKFNRIKRVEFPFVTEVTKCAPERALRNLGVAFKNFFNNVKQGKKPGYPKFKPLNIKGMLSNHHIAKALSDASLGELLRQIEYKAKWRGVAIIKADQFYPSSKKCSQCGNLKKKDELTLKDRIYECSKCGLILDRDLNASVNLKNFAVGFTVGSIEESKACCLGSADTINFNGVKLLIGQESSVKSDPRFI